MLFKAFKNAAKRCASASAYQEWVHALMVFNRAERGRQGSLRNRRTSCLISMVAGKARPLRRNWFQVAWNKF
jgi:hypothetical protein